MTGRKITPTGILAAPAGLPEDQWLALRRTGLGGSDIPAALGMNPYQSPYELYLGKRGKLPDIPVSDRLERAARWGHLHEPLIAAEFTRRTGLRTRRVGMIRHAGEPWRMATLDRQVLGCPLGGCLLEIKNRSAWKTTQWGESGDPAGVPDAEALQTHWYMSVTGYRHAHVAVLLNGNDDRYYTVCEDPVLAADILAMARQFWQRVTDGNPPPIGGGESVPALLNALWPATIDSQVVLAPGQADDLLAQRHEFAGQVKRYEALLARRDNELKMLLGDAETAIRDGEPLFTWKRNGPFARTRFTRDHPDLAVKYTRTTEVLDTDALAAGHPDLYRAYRSRILRIHQGADSE